MKSTVKSIIAIGALAATAIAQDQFPNDFPACGRTCITNMLAQAPGLGCPGAPDPQCLCRNPNFAYGVRDCSNEHCTESGQAATAINYGITYCRNAGIEIPIEGGGGSGSGGSGGAPSGTGGAGGGAGGASSTPVTTAPVVTTISTDGSVVTSTIGSTTLFSVVGGGAGGEGSSVPIATSSFTTVVTGPDGSVVTSTGESTIFGTPTPVSTSEVVSTGTSGMSTFTTTSSSVVSSAGGTTTSSPNFAPQKTAAPAGIIAAAGLAALLL